MVDEIARASEDEQTADCAFITTERSLSVTSVDGPVEEISMPRCPGSDQQRPQLLVSLENSGESMYCD